MLNLLLLCWRFNTQYNGPPSRQLTFYWQDTKRRKKEIKSSWGVGPLNSDKWRKSHSGVLLLSFTGKGVLLSWWLGTLKDVQVVSVCWGLCLASCADHNDPHFFPLLRLPPICIRTTTTCGLSRNIIQTQVMWQRLKFLCCCSPSPLHFSHDTGLLNTFDIFTDLRYPFKHCWAPVVFQRQKI